MLLVIRYRNREGNIQERFMKFKHCTSGTYGKAPAPCMMTCITVDLGLDIKTFQDTDSICVGK